MKFNNLLLLSVSLVFLSCEQRLSTDSKLAQKIKEDITSGQKTLKLGEITDFSWDSLLILTPYASPHQIEEQFGIDLSRTKHSGIESRDDINQLVFFSNGEPVRMVEYPRYPGDFSNNQTMFIQRDSAIFDIITTKQKTVGDDNWIELKKQ